MELIYQNSIRAEDYNQLRDCAGWTRLPTEQLAHAIENSAYLICCCDAEQVVGAARVLWDGGALAVLADVIVLPDYRGRGIGSTLVTNALAFLREQRKGGWKINVILLAAHGKEGFYRRFGFVERPTDALGAGMSLWLTE